MDMTIDIQPMGDEVYAVDLDPMLLDMLYSLEPDSAEVTTFSELICHLLGVDLITADLGDYQQFLSNSTFADPSGYSVFDWHCDVESSDTDVGVLLIYRVKPTITAETGMRIGFRNLDHADREFWFDITDGMCILSNQSHERYQHCVESYKGGIDYRHLLNIRFTGLQQLKQQRGLVNYRA